MVEGYGVAVLASLIVIPATLLNVCVPDVAIGVVTVIASEEDVPLHPELNPNTVIFPAEALAEKLTVIEFVFDPAVIDPPVGNVHVYPVALAMEGTV
jgi:hypothetical protein